MYVICAIKDPLIKLTWNLFGLTTVLFRVTGALSCKPGYYYPLAVLQWRICVRDIKASLFPVVPLYREYILTCYPGACKMYHGARPGLARGPRETNLVPPGETLPYMGYVGRCGPKEYRFLAVLVRNGESILAILVINRVWFLHSGLELGIFPRRSYFFIIINKTVNKSRS